MKQSQHALALLGLEVPPLEADKEGRLRGGFSMFAGMNACDDGRNNDNCDCNCGCDEDEEDPDKKGNGNCNCQKKKRRKNTDCDCKYNTDCDCDCEDQSNNLTEPGYLGVLIF